MPSQELSIVHVTPHAWGTESEVNGFVKRTADELASRGHRIVIAAPSDSRTAVRESRSAIKRAAGNPGALAKPGEPRVLAIGQTLPLPSGPRRRQPPIPLDVSRILEQLLADSDFDIVHVHEPFAPSPGSAALRHSVSLNVATFHEPVERVLSTQVARTVVETFFGRIDARTVSNEATRELLQRFFSGDYEVIRPGADRAEPALPKPDGRLRIVYCAEEERGALRLFLRALRKLPAELEWEAVVRFDGPSDPLALLSRKVRERTRVVSSQTATIEELLAGADICCLCTGGIRPAPSIARRALAAGAVPVVSDLPLYRELVGDGERGLLFPVGDAPTLTAQLERLGADASLRGSLASRAGEGGEGRPWSQVADELERTYERVAARRHDRNGEPELRRRLSGRKLIHCDLHMHTDHSPDCATPARVLLETAKEQGLGAIAITDHNEISGAFEAREIAEEIGGIKVIVAEEVKTADQGEVIGLFLTEKIKRGMSLAETIAEIRRQGGLVYMPHPFDRMHSVPDYEHLLGVIDEVDILEIFNPRIAVNSFNEEAVRFARKYRIVAGAGSDSHVAQGLGSVMIKLRDFDGPDEFLQAMRDADIVRKHKNLVYVQTLKFLQTSGGRGGRSLAAQGKS